MLGKPEDWGVDGSSELELVECCYQRSSATGVSRRASFLVASVDIFDQRIGASMVRVNLNLFGVQN